MTLLIQFIEQYGEAVVDAEEETFFCFSNELPSQDLGMVDPRVETIDVAIDGVDYTIHQSPGILNSTRSAGTTGAALWKASYLLAKWIASASSPLLQHGIIGSDTTILELGCGVSAIIGLALGSKVKRYIATDQEYVAKVLGSNIVDNNRPASNAKHGKSAKTSGARYAVEFLSLDWELDSAADLPRRLSQTSRSASNSSAIDMVLACDCIYNEALIQPFVDTCVDICKLNEGQSFCLVAQQLRAPDVLEEWLRCMLRHFRVWRLGDGALSAELNERSGFVVHVAVLAERVK